LAANAIEGERWLDGSKEYCLVCTLDVKNAFNSANWNLVLPALHRMGISDHLIDLVADYLKDRVLTYSSDVGKHEYQVTGGVPEGTVLCPILWNVMYDGILRQALPEGCTVVGFADDIALVTVAKTIEEITDRCSLSIHTLMCWLAVNGLPVAEHKREAVLISSRKAVEKASASIKYLGVLIAAAKAFKSTAAISRMMANTRGPKHHSRRIRRTHMGRSYEDRNIQPRVQSCLQTLQTQMISGHGCFKEYLHRFKHEPNPFCDHCGTGSIEDAEHALFICPLYARNRAEAETITDCNLTAEIVISCMLENQCKWDAIANMAAGILKDLRCRERSRRNEYSFAAVPRERNTSISSLLLPLLFLYMVKLYLIKKNVHM